ncbi:MAG: hypothetical protein V4687_17900 [Bacteroidota bacterium]
MKSSFKCLYHLENGTLAILEIKQTNLPDQAPKSDVYKWLCLDKKSGKIIQLIFNSMDASGDIEERYFEQGYLKFNQETGTFIEKFNSAQHQLLNAGKDSISHSMVESVELFLKTYKI